MFDMFVIKQLVECIFNKDVRLLTFCISGKVLLNYHGNLTCF